MEKSLKNIIAFVNGAFATGKVGKKHTYINLKGTWYTKEKLEALGCRVVLRSARS